MTRKLFPVGFTAALLLAVALLAAGCGGTSGSSSGGSSGGGSSTDPAALTGTSWKLTAWSASSQDPNDFTITAEFIDGRIGGKSAVNQYGGPYTAMSDGSISFGDLVSTMMAGPEPDMKAEQTYLALLAKMSSFKVDGEQLTLTDGGSQELVYSVVAESPSP
jgi:heat shock protein HslJ